MLRSLIVLFSVATISFSCFEDNNINSAPEITYTGINKDSIIQGSLGVEDTLVVAFSFIDKDGDLSGINNNVMVVDDRTGDLHVTNTIPDLPAAGNGNVGSAILLIPTLCCLFETEPACSNPPGAINTMTFTISIFDAAGNESNSITTPDIRVICN